MKRWCMAVLTAILLAAVAFPGASAVQSPKIGGYTAYSMAQSDGIVLPEPGDGERLFVGMTELSDGTRLYAAFLLSANGRSVRCVSLYAEDVGVEVYGRELIFSYSIMSNEDKDILIDPAGDSIDFGESQITELVFDGDIAECIVSFTCGYKIPNTSETGKVCLEDAEMRLGGTGKRAVRAAIDPLSAETAAAALKRAEEAGVELPIAEAGEALYLGATNVSQAGELYAAFVLRADGESIRGLTVWAFDVDFAFYHEGAGTHLTGDSSAVWLSAAYALGDGDIETKLISLRELVVDGDTASGELQFRTEVLGGALVYPFDLANVVFIRQ